MSITHRQYKQSLKEGPRFRYKFSKTLRPLEESVRQWMESSNKKYKDRILEQFGIQQAGVSVYDDRTFVCNGKCIVIPVGEIKRHYVYWQPKNQRWRVVPGGYPAQWMGDLSKKELLICEGEWDCLRLHDQGFDNAITHTAGAMTWLPQWTRLFQDKKVWLSHDRDPIGMRGMAKVAGILSTVAAEVRLIDLPLPGTADAKDVTDYFRLGGTNSGFNRLIKNARPYIPRRIYRTR